MASDKAVRIYDPTETVSVLAPRLSPFATSHPDFDMFPRMALFTCLSYFLPSLLSQIYKRMYKDFVFKQFCCCCALVQFFLLGEIDVQLNCIMNLGVTIVPMSRCSVCVGFSTTMEKKIYLSLFTMTIITIHITSLSLSFMLLLVV